MSPIRVNITKDSFFDTRITIKSGEAKIKNVRIHNAISTFFLRLIGKKIDDFEWTDKEGNITVFHINRDSLINKIPHKDSLNGSRGNELVAKALDNVNKEKQSIKNTEKNNNQEYMKKVTQINYFIRNYPDRLEYAFNKSFELLNKIKPDHYDVEKYTKIHLALLNWNDLPKGPIGVPFETPPELIDSFIKLDVLKFVAELWRARNV